LKTPKKNAIAGLCSALSVVILLLSNFIPIFDLTFIIAASFLIYFCVLECGIITAVFMFISTSFFSFLLVADKSTVFTYVCIIGLYAFLKIYIDKIQQKAIKISVKLLTFILVSTAYYMVLTFLFGISSGYNDWFVSAGLQKAIPVIMIILFAIFMYVYDWCTTRLLMLYFHRFRKSIAKYLK